MKVKIPFLPEFQEPMLDGRKRWTSRTKHYGQKGDTFDKFGATFEITATFKLPLGVVAHHNFLEEGFNNSKEFIDCWNRLHPRKGYVPDQEVWVHVFKKKTANSLAQPCPETKCSPSLQQVFDSPFSPLSDSSKPHVTECMGKGVC